MTFKPIGCLSTYIAKVHYGTSFGHETIFDYGLAHISPYLKRDQINRILVYPGSFNPPHVGHQASLSYAFNNSGCGLNLIAAIILPLDDNSLIMKVGTRKGAVVLTKEQRVGLWRGQSGLEPGPSFWIFDRSTDKWNSLQKRLAEAVSADGFKIDFGSRTREHLIQLKTCGPWELVQPDMDHLQRRAKEGAYWIYSGLIMLDTTSARGILKSDPECIERTTKELLDGYVAEYEHVKMCGREDDPEVTIRFITTESAIPEVSSTVIRKIIEKTSGDKLLEELKKLVPYHDLLLRYVSKSC